MKTLPVQTEEDFDKEAWILVQAKPGFVLINPELGSHYRLSPDGAITLAVSPGTSGRLLLVRLAQGATGYTVTPDSSISGMTASSVSTTANAVTRFWLSWDEQTELWEFTPLVTPIPTPAPVDAQYIVAAANGTLTAERVATDTATITWDFSVAGQAKASVAASTFQPLDATLTSIALLGTAADKGLYTTGIDTWAEFGFTQAGRDLLDDANAAAQRTTLGLGTIATQAANSVTITGGSITGITALAVADGGTGAVAAPAARSNLGCGTIATTTICAAQADFAGADLNALKAELNGWLAKWRASGAMAT